MPFNDIERLKERIEKDPNSKLFVPLAEEYKKAGMLEEAVDVLLKGLERHPNYMSARVSLGKIYLEKGLLNEASQEFEKVVSAIPENLYAHKKLAEIYESLDNKPKAIEELRTVLRLNPIDEVAAKTLASLEESLKDVQKTEEKAEVFIELGQSETSVIGHIKEKEIENIPSIEKEVSEDPLSLIKDADILISQGRYMEAFEKYRKILSFEPENRYVLQRFEELKALLKVLGKGEENLISKLNTFLNGIKKRRNEFFSTP
ncbi:MAG: tetratricopeptide repeat protein [Thermodesulfovibrionales bacterium]